MPRAPGLCRFLPASGRQIGLLPAPTTRSHRSSPAGSASLRTAATALRESKSAKHARRECCSSPKGGTSRYRIHALALSAKRQRGRSRWREVRAAAANRPIDVKRLPGERCAGLELSAYLTLTPARTCLDTLAESGTLAITAAWATE